MKWIMALGAGVALLLAILAGCNQPTGKTLDDLPTPITPEAWLTAIVLTENAPPAGFDTVSFPQIDGNLTALPGWRYEVQMAFDGVFARTTRPASAFTRATVWYGQLGSAWRVVAEIGGDLTAAGQSASDSDNPTLIYEAVRLGPDAFLVIDSVCTSDREGDATTAASLNAANLIGGVAQAKTAVQKAIINGEQVWRYNFEAADLVMPNLQLGDEGQILAMTGDLWVAPEHNAVVRYHVNLEVENAIIFGSALPVSGQVIIRYDLYDVGVVPNISVPFGC